MPTAADRAAAALQQCLITTTNGRVQVPLEVVVNVDHPQDAEVWLDWAYNKTQGLVVPVFSYNVHELRCVQRGL